MSINPNLKFTGLVPLFSKQKTADKLVRLDFGGCLEVSSSVSVRCASLELTTYLHDDGASWDHAALKMFQVAVSQCFNSSDVHWCTFP